MSWKCALCQTAQPPRTPMNRYTIPRHYSSRVVGGQEVLAVAEAETEIPVCKDCLTKLAKGVPMARLRVRVDPRSPCPKSPPPKPAGTVQARPRITQSDDGYILFDGKWVKPQTLRQVQAERSSTPNSP